MKIVSLRDLKSGVSNIVSKALGDPRPGHKYYKRLPDGKGGWVYFYTKAEYEQSRGKKSSTGRVEVIRRNDGYYASKPMVDPMKERKWVGPFKSEDEAFNSQAEESKPSTIVRKEAAKYTKEDIDGMIYGLRSNYPGKRWKAANDIAMASIDVDLTKISGELENALRQAAIYEPRHDTRSAGAGVMMDMALLNLIESKIRHQSGRDITVTVPEKGTAQERSEAARELEAESGSSTPKPRHEMTPSDIKALDLKSLYDLESQVDDDLQEVEEKVSRLEHELEGVGVERPRRVEKERVLRHYDGMAKKLNAVLTATKDEIKKREDEGVPIDVKKYPGLVLSGLKSGARDAKKSIFKGVNSMSIICVVKALGGERAGHKYFRRVPKAGGGYTYYYTRKEWEERKGPGHDEPKSEMGEKAVRAAIAGAKSHADEIYREVGGANGSVSDFLDKIKPMFRNLRRSFEGSSLESRVLGEVKSHIKNKMSGMGFERQERIEKKNESKKKDAEKENKKYIGKEFTYHGHKATVVALSAKGYADTEGAFIAKFHDKNMRDPMTGGTFSVPIKHVKAQVDKSYSPIGEAVRKAVVDVNQYGNKKTKNISDADLIRILAAKVRQNIRNSVRWNDGVLDIPAIYDEFTTSRLNDDVLDKAIVALEKSGGSFDAAYIEAMMKQVEPVGKNSTMAMAVKASV